MATSRTRKARFSRFNQPVKCRACGKMTTQDVQGCLGLDLCGPCIREAELENEHNDSGHPTPVAGCPDCRDAAPEPEAPKTVPVRGLTMDQWSELHRQAQRTTTAARDVLRAAEAAVQRAREALTAAEKSEAALVAAMASTKENA